MTKKRDIETENAALTPRRRQPRAQRPVPGLFFVHGPRGPRAIAIPLEEGAIVIGRGAVGAALLDDSKLSRQHARISFDGERFRVRDLDSKNGTAVDGELLRGEIAAQAPLVRAGDCLFLALPDLRSHQELGVTTTDGMVRGPVVAQAWGKIEQAALAGDTLCLTGESGSGKELAARTFHRLGPHPSGPLVAVNCASIPVGVAERLLFGTRRGAYSGATDHAEGYVEAAHGGTLFLDEIAELDEAVQAKLLRVIETKEVTPLGATRARAVDFRLVAASHRGLREAVAAGRFREDLYYRLGRPTVVIPPLRDRREEIPWLIELVLKDSKLQPDASFVEECLLRTWPGNVRELLAELRGAVAQAKTEGASQVRAEHLAEEAGVRIGKDDRGESPSREAIEKALSDAGGNISGAARAMGVHRTQFRRWLIRYGLAGAGPGDLAK
jgi:DNA-binding NtrC family response regulator